MVHLIKVLSRSAGETQQLGRAIGSTLSNGDIVALTGVLGSGKSVMARGILRGLGVTDRIPSPSFIIIARYSGDLSANHIDLYRVEGTGQAIDAGVEEAVWSDAVSVIEWADRVAAILPPSRIDVKMDLRDDPDQRLVTILPTDDRMREKLQGVMDRIFSVGKR